MAVVAAETSAAPASTVPAAAALAAAVATPAAAALAVPAVAALMLWVTLHTTRSGTLLLQQLILHLQLLLLLSKECSVLGFIWEACHVLYPLGQLLLQSCNFGSDELLCRRHLEVQGRLATPPMLPHSFPAAYPISCKPCP